MIRPVSGFIVAATLLLLSGALRADLIACEGFDYAVGTPLNGRSGGTGWKGAWFGAPGPNRVVVAEPGAVFPGLVVSGRKCLLDGSDTRVFRTLDADRPAVAALVDVGPHGKTFGKDGTTVWISFLIACTSYPKSAHGGIHLMDGVELGPAYKKTQRVQMGRQNISTHWYLGRVDQGGPAAGKWDGTVTADATLRLLVYRFDFKTGPEEGWMWVDPPPGKEPDPAKADLHAPKIADFRFDSVNVGSGGGAIYVFDELRIGTTSADVLPAEKAPATNVP
jgi:hypothetical protein